MMRAVGRTLLVAAAATQLVATACNDSQGPRPDASLLPPLPLPGVATLAVSTSTSGSDLDPDGYTVTVDGGTSQSIGTNGLASFIGLAAGDHTVDGGQSKAIGINNTLTISGLSPGNLSVQLNGLAQNCTVSSNPRTVSITAGSTTKTTFSVGCTATTGTLKVTTSTSGSVPTNNYTVTVDWNTASAQQIAPNNGSVSFSNLSATGHSVALSGFPANCTVTSANPQSVNVPAGGTATAPFTVSCTATTGTLKVTTSTSGSVPTNNYTVTVDWNTASAQQIAPNNGSVSFSNLSATSHSVALSGFPANCTVTSANPQSVNVPAGGTATAPFTVSCTATATTGTLTVTTTTTGSNLDLDGYTFTVTGAGQTATRAIATNGTSTFSGIPTGSYQVQLTPSSVAANCSVTNANPQTVNVPAGGTATTNFAVTCTTGTITISNTTTGSNLDPDGYAVIVTASDGTQEPATMATNGSVTGELSTGSYQVQLTPSSVAANCTVTSANPQTANVPAGGTVTITFNVSCSASTP